MSIGNEKIATCYKSRIEDGKLIIIGRVADKKTIYSYGTYSIPLASNYLLQYGVDGDFYPLSVSDYNAAMNTTDENYLGASFYIRNGKVTHIRAGS